MVSPAGLGAFFSVLYNFNQTKLLAETTIVAVMTPLKKKLKLTKVSPKIETSQN